MLSLQCDLNVSKSLQWLRGKGELCDVVVIGGDGQQTSAHSCVLAAHSTVIAAVLQGRLGAQRDWSVLRPLVISIDNVTMSPPSPQQGGTSEVNTIEALVGLLYGETVNVSSIHLATLNEYAYMLGLSHQICTCLEMSKERNSFHVTENNSSTSMGVTKKKHSRKPVLKKCFEKKENEVEQIEPVNEGCLVNETIPEQLSNSLQNKHSTDCPLPENLEVKVNCENSILELSVLCSNDQDMDTNANNNWTLVQCRDKHVDNEQQSNSQIQESNACNNENSASLEGVRDLTIDAPMESLNIKMEAVSHTETESDGNIHSANDSTNDILGLVVNKEEQLSVYCGDNQHLQHQKKHKQKSIGKGLMCTVCGTSFQRCGDLVKHVQHTQHFTSQCPLCFIQVRDLEGQRLHFALHDQELPFFCMYCDLRFRTRAALTMHTPKHSTTKPFVCSECGRGFKWRHALQAHLYTHSPTSRLLCDICGFSSKYTRVHQCEVCGHSFSHAKNMRRHMRLHAPASNLLTCTTVSKLQCNFRTTRPDKLRDHLTKKHNISRHTISSDPFAKLLSTSSVAGNDSDLVKKPTIDVLQGLDDLKATTNSSDFCTVVQESNAVIKDFEKLHPKLEKAENMNNVTAENGAIFQNSGQVHDSDLSGHTDLSTEQETFSVLVSSPDIVDLPDIQSLESHAGQSAKQQSVTEIADTFPSGFLVEHDLLLNKPESDVNESQRLDTENSISALQGSLITQPDHKLRLSVNNPVQDQGDLDLVDSVSYSNHCTFPRSENSVVLEVMAPDGDISTQSSNQRSGISLMDQDTLQKKTEKQEQCMESLNILEFMLDNVTD
ncbi:uncharacterized protein [Panulirus ornatus]|uniref:uncharacterized protein isoform X2 n=1 Tax=Panulirus ornatus TaxID=150431 RepID=UPI003A8814EB